MKKRTPTIHDPRYVEVINLLIKQRKQKKLSQQALSETTGIPRTDISKIENRVRRLDILELTDILKALDITPSNYLNTLFKS